MRRSNAPLLSWIACGDDMHEQAGKPTPEHGNETSQPDLHVLRTGTYLHTHCPSCNANLLEDEWIRLNVTAGKEKGELLLSPRFNVFDKSLTISLNTGEEVDDFSCPRCNETLMDETESCEICGSRTARILVSAVQLDIHLYVCARMGCPWHGLSEKDRERLILDK